MAIAISSKYPGRSTAPSASHPFGSFKNESSENADDGTPLEKDWQDEVFALRDCILDAAGVTPDGNIDSVTTSQVWDALREGGTLSLSAIGEDGNAVIDDGDYTMELDPNHIRMTKNTDATHGATVMYNTVSISDATDKTEILKDRLNVKLDNTVKTSVKQDGIYHNRTILDGSHISSSLTQFVIELDVSSWTWSSIDTHRLSADGVPLYIDMDAELGQSFTRIDNATLAWKKDTYDQLCAPVYIAAVYELANTRLKIYACHALVASGPDSVSASDQKLILTLST